MILEVFFIALVINWLIGVHGAENKAHKEYTTKHKDLKISELTRILSRMSIALIHMAVLFIPSFIIWGIIQLIL